MTGNYIKRSEAAVLAKTGTDYLAKLIERGELDAYFEQRGELKYWYVNTACPRFKKLLARLTPKIEETVCMPGTDECPIDWDEWASMCLNKDELVASELADRTLQEYRRYCKNFFLEFPILSRNNLRGALDAYRRKAEKTPGKDYARSKRMLFQSLMTIARYYVYKGYRKPDFVAEIAKLKPEKSDKETAQPCYTQEIVAEAIKRIHTAKSKKGNMVYSEYDRALNSLLIEFAYITGARASEITGLRLEDINWVEKKVRFVFAKGQRERTVGITDGLIKHMQAYAAIRKAVSNKALQKNTEAASCFWVSENGASLRGAYFSRRMGRLSKWLGFRFIPHGIRRTAITDMLVEEGYSLPSVQLMVGHSSMEVTSKYTKPTEKAVVSVGQSRKFKVDLSDVG
jgi:integrase